MDFLNSLNNPLFNSRQRQLLVKSSLLREIINDWIYTNEEEPSSIEFFCKSFLI